MPARSEAQRRYLNARFGHAWTKRHHFDNAGPLPEHVQGGGHSHVTRAIRRKKRRRRHHR